MCEDRLGGDERAGACVFPKLIGNDAAVLMTDQVNQGSVVDIHHRQSAGIEMVGVLAIGDKRSRVIGGSLCSCWRDQSNDDV